MSASLPLLVRTFVIGVAVAAPVGAMGMLCIQRTLARGFSAGIATGLGIATADGIYAGIAAFGISAVSGALVSWQVPLRLVGGGALVYLGVRSMRSGAQRAAEQEARDDDERARERHAGLYASAVALTLTNPTTIIAFGAVFASAGLTAQPGLSSALLATAGVALGSLSWWLLLVSGVALARSRVGERLLSAVGLASGVVLIGFGLLAIVSAFSG